MNDNGYTSIIHQACNLISSGSIDEAASVIRIGYPFSPTAKSGRNYTPRTMTKIFVRDGFIDRYRGTKLVFPPTLRILSQYLPLDFPYHKNGKMTEGHFAYWELFPTIDHAQPVARGGINEEDNFVCCSLLTNSIKSNWTLEQLQWELLPRGDVQKWDGMMNWFLNQIEKDNSLLEIPYLKTWWNAAKATTVAIG
ncbi:MAG: HNH endonuclease [Pyrinomonadaceae bacterium]